MPAPRVLVVKLSSLGDLFHALPAVHGLKQGLGAVVDWVTQPEYAGLVRCFTDVDRVILFPRRGFLTGARAFLSDLRRERYDLAVDLQGLLKSALVTRLTRAARRLGPSYHREGAHRMYHETAAPAEPGRHAVEQAFDSLRALNLPAQPPVFPVSFPSVAVNLPRPRIALLPCSRWPTKNWGADSFAAAARELIKRAGASIVLLGAPADQPVCRRIADQVPGSTDLSGKTSLVELGGWLAQMDLVISVDSGPMHMAAALGRPVLALFGPTDPARTGPYGEAHRVLQIGDLPCRPCYRRSCERKDLACLERISPEQVVANAMEMLNR